MKGLTVPHEDLTLRVDKEIIRKAKRFAEEHDTSVSGLVEGYLDGLGQAQPTAREHGPVTKRLRGSLAPENAENGLNEEDYRRYLQEKHG